MSETSQQRWIANFWRRIGAFLLDSVVIGCIGFILGLAFESAFAQLANWGRLVGFGIALAYFGLMNSALCGGQTIGKRVLKLRVVNAGNNPITPMRAFCRQAVFSTPLFLNGAPFSNAVLTSFLIYPLALIVLGGLLSIVYLYVFNRRTRQSLHDLAVGTYVVNKDAQKQDVGEVWKVHLAVVALIFVASGLVPVFTGKLAQDDLFRDMLETQGAISAEPGVNYSTITSSTTTSVTAKQGSSTTTLVTSQVFLADNRVSDADLARHFAVSVANNYPDSKSKDAIRIVLTYGYDIGISSRWTSQVYDFLPGELESGEQ